MQPLDKIIGIAVPLDEPNIDTNQLCPSRFNKISRGPRYAQILFHDHRFNPDGSEKDHILNREPFRRARIIVADRGFGCGSSRETAVYALYEFGIRCVVATSFGDIHASNCCKNGILPLVLDELETKEIRRQLHQRPGTTLAIDLDAQTVLDGEGRVHRFLIDPVRKKCLLEGLDDVARTQQYRPRMERFEATYRARVPWLFDTGESKTRS